MIDQRVISAILDSEIEVSFLPVYLIAGFLFAMGAYAGFYSLYQKSRA